MTALHTVDDVTCLGCGCACDDIRVIVNDGLIVDTHNTCVLGTQWFGDGRVPARIIVDGRDVPLDEAIDAAASRLVEATRAIVYLAPSVSCETQREGVAIADLIRARLDSVTSATVLPLILSAQERGFASATLGEIRNRADVVVFWGVDIERRYPRFVSRYAPDPIGTHVPNGRSGRRVIAVDVGAARSTADADDRFAIDPTDELAVLTALQALVGEPGARSSVSRGEGSAWRVASELASQLVSGRYVAIVFDGEPDDRVPRSPQRFDAILAFSHTLNERFRGAAVALRGSGNRSGADWVFTAQTGFPLGVDFGRGVPRFEPYGAPTLAGDAALIIGDGSLIPESVIASVATARTIVIGPRASNSPFGSGNVIIDTGEAGIHFAGTAFRTDDVPLPLRAPLPTGLSTTDVVAALARSIAKAARND